MGRLRGTLLTPKQGAETASTEPASAEANDVPALKQALELYYQKYKAQKRGKETASRRKFPLMFFEYLSSKVYQEFDELKVKIEQEKEQVEHAFRISEDRAQIVSRLSVWKTV